MRVGVVGCGRIGRRRAEMLRQFPDDKLVMVADVARARAEALAADMGCEATGPWEGVVDSDVEAVIVATTNEWLAPISLAALEAGRHVLVEKPMSRTPAEAEALCAAAAAHGVVLKVGFNHRHHPAIARAYQICQAGCIGEVLLARCRYGHGGRLGYEKEWRMNPAISGGGELLDQGIHAVDLFRWFLGELAEAMGFTAAYVWVPNTMPTAGDFPDDNAFALFRTEAGQIASLHVSWTQWKNLFSLEVFGRTGYVLIEGLGDSYGPERLTLGQRKMGGGPPEEQVTEFPPTDTSWHDEWQEFAAAIRERRQPLGGGADGLQALRAVHAVYDAAREGRVIRLRAVQG